MNILIIEDDIEFLAFLRALLADKWGHKVSSARTGWDGIEKASRENYDLVLLDIYLPDGLGHSLIKPIKELNHRVNIITMTGYNDLNLEKEVRAKGISYYLIKPFDLDSLKAIVDHLDAKQVPIDHLDTDKYLSVR